MITSQTLDDCPKPPQEIPFRQYENWPQLLSEVNSGRAPIDGLPKEEFINVAWEFCYRRGFNSHSGYWFDADAGAYFALIGNGTTWHWALHYVKVEGEFSLTDVHNIRLLLRQRTNVDVVHFSGPGVLPPARIVARLCGKAVERIDTNLLKRWVFDPQNKEELFDLQKDYLNTIMEIGTIGLEQTEGGTIIVPDEFQVSSFGDFVDRLGIGQTGRNLLTRVDFLPFTLLRTIQQHPQLMHQMPSRDFEVLVAEILSRLDFAVELTPRSGDGGKDIVGERVLHGVPLKFFFECKRYSETNKVGVAHLRSLLGAVNANEGQANIGVLVTTSKFTKGSIDLIASDARLDGKDFDDLQVWLDEIMAPNTSL